MPWMHVKKSGGITEIIIILALDLKEQKMLYWAMPVPNKTITIIKTVSNVSE